MEQLLIALLLFPLVGSILNGLLLRPKSPIQSGVLATFFAGVSFIATVVLFFSYQFQQSPQALAISFPWFEVGNLKVKWGFRFDSLTAVMGLVVTGIGSLIHCYSIGYMNHEKTPWRYFAYLNLFLFNMLVLITGDSLPVLFVGWEGVGLCSYLLIGYWFEDVTKSAAGMKAFVVNRIGDACFLLGCFFLFRELGTLEFQGMFESITQTKELSLSHLSLGALFLFLGATGKSAQMPLFVWLPDAMAGPTPVSALIHAATMVTAGIYLICRMHFLFCIAPEVNLFIACIGTATALLAALIATSQRDIKKILAYSTVSQLGLMFLALGAKAYFAAIFHVMTHAFFKALLFLGAGSVIHALEGEQDIFKMGGLRKKIPVTFWTFTIGTIAICGIPPFSGFFSKDTILYSALGIEHYEIQFWGLGLLVSSLTAFYMTRVYVLTFWGEYRGEHSPHESPLVMTVPLMALAFGSAIVGFLGVPHGFHLLPNYLQHFLEPVLPLLPEAETIISEHTAMWIATLFVFVFCCLSFAIYIQPKRPESLGSWLKPLRALFENKFWIDELYSILLVRPFSGISDFLARFFDPKIVDGMVHLPGKVSKGGALLLSLLQVGSVQFYLLVMIVGALFLYFIAQRGFL